MKPKAFLSLSTNVFRIRDKSPQESGNMQTHLLVNVGQLGLKTNRRVVETSSVFWDGAASCEEESERSRVFKRQFFGNRIIQEHQQGVELELPRLFQHVNLNAKTLQDCRGRVSLRLDPFLRTG